jgi:hypothetical protein
MPDRTAEEDALRREWEQQKRHHSPEFQGYIERLFKLFAVDGLRGAAPDEILKLAQDVDRAVNAWIGCEAPRVNTGGEYWGKMEIARGRLRAALNRVGDGRTP